MKKSLGGGVNLPHLNWNRANVKVDLSNYATKTDIKNISHVDTSSFAPIKFSKSKN